MVKEIQDNFLHSRSQETVRPRLMLIDWRNFVLPLIFVWLKQGSYHRVLDMDFLSNTMVWCNVRILPKICHSG